MGKPSSTRISKTSSHSNSRASLTTMRSKKKQKFRNKSFSKTQKNIQKVFNNLKNESIHDFNNSNNTVIVLDDSIGNCMNDDDNDVIHITGVQCSTPLTKSKDRNLSELNLSRVSKNNTVEQNSNLEQNEICDLTKVIKRDSFITVDLTTESACDESNNNTVIDLEKNETQDCVVVSSNNSDFSFSSISDITVIPNTKETKRINKFVKGISTLNASDKGKLLELITQKLFNGCKVPENVMSSLASNLKATKATETVEDTYIKEVILGQVCSRSNSIGSNIYNPERDVKNRTGLRMIVIDGSNIAIEHARGRMFSVKGLKICIDYFLKRGHVVKAFVPRFRCKFGKSSDPKLLDDLERRGLVVYTPSREIQGKMITSYDDRYIVQAAAEFDGVIVSGDNYRDLLKENPRWRFIIENRVLPFTWVQDMIMFPKDPLGRNGPTLEQFLRHC